MLNGFITALIYSLVKILSGEEVKIPEQFETYLENREKIKILEDFQLALDYMKGEQGIKLHENPFFQAIAEFLSGTFATRMEAMNEVAGESDKTRGVIAEKLIPSDTMLAESLKKLLTTSNSFCWG